MVGQSDEHTAREIQRYIEAGTRKNTRVTYQAAIDHFEVSWGGFLPTTSDQIVKYLVDHAEKLAVSTLKLRLAALAQWHITQGFPDPTKTPVIRQVLKGIRTVHGAPKKQAAPLEFALLEQAVQWLEGEIRRAQVAMDQAAILRCKRDKALILIGFWRGFRRDELCRLRVEHIQVAPGKEMTLFLPSSKGDRQSMGTTFKAPALPRLCPVQAYEDWITSAGLVRGPVFRKVGEWGSVSDSGLHTGSVSNLLRRVLDQAGIDGDLFSSHSLRRGFANWAVQSGWDIKALMTYVGWTDLKSAMEYIEPATMNFDLLTSAATNTLANEVSQLPKDLPGHKEA